MPLTRVRLRSAGRQSPAMTKSCRCQIQTKWLCVRTGKRRSRTDDAPVAPKRVDQDSDHERRQDDLQTPRDLGIQAEEGHPGRTSGCNSQRTCPVAIPRPRSARRRPGLRRSGRRVRARRVPAATQRTVTSHRCTAKRIKRLSAVWRSWVPSATRGGSNSDFRPRRGQPVKLHGIADGLVIDVTHGFDSQKWTIVGRRRRNGSADRPASHAGPELAARRSLFLWWP